MSEKLQGKSERGGRMTYLYKYIDMNDNITKYVGIVSEKNRELKDRIIEHCKKDVWSHGYFRVEYIELQSKTDAEYLESHFISVYQTDKYFNKAKKEWGKSALLDNHKFIWKLYIIYNNDITMANIDTLVKNSKELKNMVDRSKKYSIWQGKNGAWYVYVPDVTKKRKRRLIKRKSREDLEQYLKKFYNTIEE